MRLAGQAKAGFYPTPPEVTRIIASCLRSQGGATLLDPCCGEGYAAETLGRLLGAATYGVELSVDRAAASKERLDSVIQGNALITRLDEQGGKFGLLYNNPPYDNGDRERLESRFLYHTKDMLQEGGVLVFVVSEPYMDVWAKTLTPYFDRLQVFRFPAPHYDAFKQVVIFGVRRGATGVRHSLGEPQVLREGCCRYVVPRSSAEPYLYIARRDPQELYAFAVYAEVWRKVWGALSGKRDSAAFRPLLPLRQGHLALLIAGGLLNGCVVEAQGRRLLVKGKVTKGVKVKLEASRDDKDPYTKRTERDVFNINITALDLNTGELVRIGDEQVTADDTQEHEGQVAA